MPVTVAVTEKEYRKAESVFAAAADLRCIGAPDAEDGLAAVMREHGAQHAIVGVRPYTGALYGALPRGGVLARFGVGHDGIDKLKATRAGVLCTNTPKVLDQSVAEHTLLLMLAAARHFPAASTAARDGSWQAPVGRELHGKTLAVIGCGGIGRAVARIAANGFGMRVVGYSRSAAAIEGFAAVHADFAAAAADADFVSLHIPAVTATRGFLNAGRLSLLPSRAWVINTARGSVLDETALCDALRAGRIAGAALDVFEREPYQPASPSCDLRSFSNVILTPHIASNTSDANTRMAARALHNIRLAEAGRFKDMDLLNPEVVATLSR